MKRLIIFMLLVNSFSLNAQNLFSAGMEYFKNGDYYKADSLFRLHLKNNPNDNNAIFNVSLIKFYQGDTCSFCNQISNLWHRFDDKESCDLFFEICGTSDTAYYDKKKLECDEKAARYTKITETNICNQYKKVYLHDRRKKGRTIQFNPTDITNLKSTDIVAIYYLYNNNDRLFVYSLKKPKGRGGDNARHEYMLYNTDIQNAKEELKLKKFVANIEYVVDKFGNIKDVELINTSYEVDNQEKLMEYINLVVSGMPNYIPAQFENENVNYLVRDFISFW